MYIEKEQWLKKWYRTDCGKILKVKNVPQKINDLYLILDYINGKEVWFKIHEDNIADTPQELVRVEDLVELQNPNNSYPHNPFGIIHDIDDLIYLELSHKQYNISDFKITKILTPNEKGGFDLQWEAKK